MTRIKWLFFLLISLAIEGFSDRRLVIKDVPGIMEQFFSYHVESKNLNPVIVRRCFKIYIEQFDPEKIYLLQTEVDPYLLMSDGEAMAVADRMKVGDFSDFIALNDLLISSIYRSHTFDDEIMHKILLEIRPRVPSLESQYAQNDEELFLRQESRAFKFYSFHAKKMDLISQEKKMKVFSLMQKKINRLESPYLLMNEKGEPFSKEQKEHLYALRILKSFAKSLDAHTAFFSEEEALEMRMTLEKQFEGLGVVLSEGVDGIVIAEVIEGSPAHKSGKVQANDILVEIDGISLNDMSFEEVLRLLKEKNGHTLGVERDSYHNRDSEKKKFFRVFLAKAPIVVEGDRVQYSYERYDGGIIATIIMNAFYENDEGANSEQDIKRTIAKLRTFGPIRGLILDLRENSGGFLSQAVKVASLFISSGVVVISKYSKGEPHYLRSLDPKTYYDGPLILLTSKLSASAAEIVAQALQDYGAALIVGDKTTFGKGSIQFQTVTNDRAEHYYKITVGRYYTVSGKSTQIDGVIADIVVPTIFAPFNIGERYLEYPLSADRLPQAYNDPLADVDGATKRWFQKNYLPFQQKKITNWHKMLSELKKRSQVRIAANREFQKLLRIQEKMQAKLTDKETYLEYIKEFSSNDMQQKEAVNILKDMIDLHSQTVTIAPPLLRMFLYPMLIQASTL